MAFFTHKRNARVTEKLYWKYAYYPFEAGNLANSRNLNTLGSIPMKWVVAWELDDDRDMWCEEIEVTQCQTCSRNMALAL